ncbi:MAG: hypothetical protein ABSE56_17775 [Bryobacteraceae bacterium]
MHRKVLTPNDFKDLDVLAERLLEFQHYWETTARLFEWKFTGQDLRERLIKLDQQAPAAISQKRR